MDPCFCVLWGWSQARQQVKSREVAAGARSLLPCLGREEQGTFLCPDFKGCCCIYRAQQPWQPSLAGALAAAVCCCSLALLGSCCPFGLTALGEMPAPSLWEPGYVLWVCDSTFP